MKQIHPIPEVMATVADVRCTPEFIERLAAAGMTAVRINSAHVTPDSFRQMADTIRTVDPGIKILMDTKGPEVRTTELPEPVTITRGQRIDLRSGNAPSSSRCVYITVSEIEKYVDVNNEILLDDGEIKLRVTAVDGSKVVTEATQGGILCSRKTVAFPQANVPPLPAVSDRDRANIAMAVKCGIDMIAHSFVRSRDDVEAVRKLIAGSDMSLYAKIECREAIDNMDSIAASADGLLVARGDLGTHIPLTDVPGVQFKAIETARRYGKQAILATQILQSMLTKPQPTRAELSDITLAVLQGFDILLLCGETAQGEYPAECVATLSQTVKSASCLPWKISKTI